ncbi:MAG TPA: cupredoxin family copper-binding protein [Gemmatimonadales bacterium]|jgi:plastocyanin|nr:cupredoxin family copper-binding protein [Gemmatimonadales bacterium]
MLRRGCLLAATLCLLAGRAVGAQTVLDRTPNLAGAWVGAAGVLHFNFLHRFSVSSAPERKVTSAPTFLLAAGLPGATLLGVHYASNSALSARYPNEWELFGRFAPLDQELRGPVDAAVQAGYNLAAEGPDAELSVARREGPVRVLGALRVLSEPGDAGGADLAVAMGAALRLTRGLALSADVATPTDRASGERVAWAAGVSLAIPHTPHTLSLHATNTNNATLQSSSRGTRETRYGFEFTIPVTLSRYLGGGRRAPAPPAGAPGPATRDTVVAEVRDFMFRPARLTVAAGTTVVWTNAGQMVHTVTAADGSFDSGPIETGRRMPLAFTRPGTFPFHCTPHPFMRGEIVVR